jgi:hypothetical protein
MTDQTNQLFEPFWVLLSKSFARTNKNLLRLIAVLALITAFLAAYALIIFGVAALAIYGAGYFLSDHGLVRAILFVVLAIVGAYAFIRWNGAIAYAYAADTIDPENGGSVTSILTSAKTAWNTGLGFFVNSFNAGVLIIFGQMLAVCPCFLLQNNFIFSPYLYVYEQMHNHDARARSRELTKGFGWVVLQRSAIFLLIGYIVLVLMLLAILAPDPLFWVILVILLALYAGALQSQFIRQIYLESKNVDRSRLAGYSQKSWVTPAILTILLILILYYGAKIAFLFLAVRK